MGGLFMKPTPRPDGPAGLQAIEFFPTMAHRRAPKSNADFMMVEPHGLAGNAGYIVEKP